MSVGRQVGSSAGRLGCVVYWKVWSGGEIAGKYQWAGVLAPAGSCTMRLELSHIRQPETEFNKVFQPADLASGDEEYRVTAPVDLRMVIHKDQDRFRLVGTVEDGARAGLQPLPRAVQVAGRS